MSLWMLFTVFFKVGLFTIGGGLASIGLLHEYLVETGYLTSVSFYDMFAISQSTPGPIGINMATFVGYKYAGISGAAIATFALVLPSLVIITILAYSLKAARKNSYIDGIFSGCRPAAIGIIASVAYFLSKHAVFNFDNIGSQPDQFIFKIALFGLTILLSVRFSFHPLICIAIGGAGGLLFC